MASDRPFCGPGFLHSDAFQGSRPTYFAKIKAAVYYLPINNSLFLLIHFPPVSLPCKQRDSVSKFTAWKKHHFRNEDLSDFTTILYMPPDNSPHDLPINFAIKLPK